MLVFKRSREVHTEQRREERNPESGVGGGLRRFPWLVASYKFLHSQQLRPGLSPSELTSSGP